MRYLKLLQIANQAKIVGDKEGQYLANIIFAHLLWFLFDTDLEDDTGDWHGEVCSITDLQSEQAGELYLRLMKWNDHENEYQQVDCVSIQTTSCSAQTLKKVRVKVKFVGRDSLVPQPVDAVQEKILNTLWQDFFNSAGSFFHDLDGVRDFEEMIKEMLSIAAAESSLQAMKHHLQFSSP